MLRRTAAALAVAGILVGGLAVPAEARSMQGTRCSNGAPIVLKPWFEIFGQQVMRRGCAW